MSSEFSYQLSCIVPIYNVEEYLEACLESLLKVSAVRMEIILVDDGSTDLSGKIADRYATQRPFIKVIHQYNQGLAVARNHGLEAASGNYIVFIDSDDWVNPEQLSELYLKAEEMDVDMALGAILYVDPDKCSYSPFLPLPESVIEQMQSGKNCFANLFLAGKFVPMATSYLYRRSWLKNNNFRFESVLHEDELWSVEALCLADRVICTELPFYYYRQRAGSIMNTLDAGKRLNSLLYIASRLLRFAERFDAVEERLTWSLLYAKSAQLYKLAFWLLDKKRDSRFRLAPHSLHQIYHKRHLLTAEARSLCLSCFQIAHKKLKNYHSWRISAEVTGVPKVIPNETTVILFHNRMWEAPLIYPKEQVPEGILITSDQKYLDRADVVVFHLPTLYFDLEGDLDKPEKQRWVGWTLECEENYPFIKSTEFMGLFDYWMSYHQGADIIYPYYENDYPARLQQTVLQSFESLDDVCMMVSSSFNQSGRQGYLKELMQEMQIDSYGKLFNNCRLEKDGGHSSKMALFGHYKFVIAFENSCAEDYVTEKFFDPLLVGAVPIYLGAPNIDELAPGDNCYVDVRKYKTAGELAVHLKACCENPTLYAQYHQWRKEPLRSSFIDKAALQKIHPFIRLCHLVKSEQKRFTFQKKPEGQLFLCSFGDSRYEASRERLQEQAEDFNLFDSIHLYNEYDLSTSFRNDFQEYLSVDIRGFGFWVWKPFIILNTLAGMDEGDVLLYVDMGCHLNSRGKEKLIDYWKEVKQNKSGFLVSQLEPVRKECFWTKGDLLDYFGIRGKVEMYSPQYQSGVIFIRKEPKTVALVKSWLKVYYENFNLVDDTLSQSPNEEGFVEHRHDQSVLSLLLKRHGTSVIRLEEVYRPKWNLYSRFYPILIKRDLI